MRFNKKLILASKSPRRYELLSPYFEGVEVVTNDIQEKYSSVLPNEIVEELARLKLGTLGDTYYNDYVISGDTIVWFNGKLYGKPKDKKDAFRMLSELSGNCHEVYSGFAVAYKGRIIVGSEVSKITFKNLSDDVINNYIETGSPLDKAGSYGIQDGVVVDSFTGDINNIIGLPLEKILQVCKEMLTYE